MRPSGDFVSPHLALGVVWVWDPCFKSLPKFMTIREHRYKDRFENWQLCCVLKLPFCHHRAIKLTQICFWFNNPRIDLLDPSSVAHECHPKVLKLLSLLHLFFSLLIFIPGWLHAAENRSSECWRPCSEDANRTKLSGKSKQLILQLP